ncbi:MAG: VPLPA-CTERM sorting domain-containing protein [Halioglobus sp.]
MSVRIGGLTYNPFGAPIDACVDNLAFVATIGGGVAVPGLQNIAGLQLVPGVSDPPGLCDGGFGGTGFHDAVVALTVLGTSVGMFQAGTITLTEVAAVPVPAAAWLFGSALLGLAGVKRKRAV